MPPIGSCVMVRFLIFCGAFVLVDGHGAARGRAGRLLVLPVRVVRDFLSRQRLSSLVPGFGRAGVPAVTDVRGCSGPVFCGERSGSSGAHRRRTLNHGVYPEESSIGAVTASLRDGRSGLVSGFVDLFLEPGGDVFGVAGKVPEVDEVVVRVGGDEEVGWVVVVEGDVVVGGWGDGVVHREPGSAAFLIHAGA